METSIINKTPVNFVQLQLGVPKVNEVFGETVPSKANVGLQVANGVSPAIGSQNLVEPTGEGKPI